VKSSFLARMLRPYRGIRQLGYPRNDRQVLTTPRGTPPTYTIQSNRSIVINMKYDPEKHHRRSIRLRGYDYRSVGAYYVTICCHKRQCLLGEIINGEMQPNIIGSTVQAIWNRLPHSFPFVELDAFVVMPNHVHGIIVIRESTSKQVVQGVQDRENNHPSLPRGTKSGSLGAIVQNFKSIATRRANAIKKNTGTLWQRGFHDEIIRDDRAYEYIRRYIIARPLSNSKLKIQQFYIGKAIENKGFGVSACAI